MTPQRLGQHFLKDAVWRGRILRALPLPAPGAKDELWLEIGAGHGEMTRVRFDILRQAPASICNREIPGVHDGAPQGHG